MFKVCFVYKQYNFIKISEIFFITLYISLYLVEIHLSHYFFLNFILDCIKNHFNKYDRH